VLILSDFFSKIPYKYRFQFSKIPQIMLQIGDIMSRKVGAVPGFNVERATEPFT
jgi:hypothetical protein